MAPPWPRRAATFVATLGGIGWTPWAPGTWGSVVGLLLGLLAARTLGPSHAFLLLVLTFLGCASCCARAERQLDRHDPPAVILDEVWGMAAILVALPGSTRSVPRLLAALLLFRFFDIVKPPPVKRLARLPGGWGIMADDLGAALYTIAVLMLCAPFLP